MSAALEVRDYSQFRVVPRTPVIGGWIEGCHLSELTEAGRADLRDALRTYGKTQEQSMPVNAKYRLFDAMGGELVTGIADRYWTEKTGTRTPENGMLQFWDDKPADETGGINVDDLLRPAVLTAGGAQAAHRQQGAADPGGKP